jgi:signal transduction histidine kinase
MSIRLMPQKKNTESAPVFKRFLPLLMAVSLMGPIIAVGVATAVGSLLPLPPWMIGLITGAVTSTLIAVVLSARTQKVEYQLREVEAELRAIVRGAIPDRVMGDGDAETLALRQVIDTVSKVLIEAKATDSDHRFLQNVLDTLPDPLVVLDSRGMVELSNRRFSDLLSFDETMGPVGRGLGTLAGVAMPDWYRQILDADADSAEAVEVEFTGSDGEIVTMLASGALLRDTENRPSRVVLLVRDPNQVEKLSKRLEAAQDKAAESAEVFQNLFDAIEDPITVLGLNGEIMQANRAARNVFGRNLVGQKCYRAFRMRDTVCENCPASLTYANKQSTVVEHRIFGNAITRINTYPLLGKNGEVKAILNHKRDVTNERQLEELKASFLAAVSHELRTPLTSIIGFNKLNRRRMTRHLSAILESAPHKARVAFQQILDDMDIMVSEGERLGRLVNDILDLSKLEAGRMQLQMGEVNIIKVINGSVAATSALWRSKELHMDCEFDFEVPDVWGDADRLAQVVVNLISNATKFTAAGSISVNVVVEDVSVTVSVRDTGRGIPPDQLNNVFEKFRQVEEVNAGSPLGTGLGLPICRELINLHGGRIWVESTLGVGTTFNFTLLRADAKPDPAPLTDRMSFTGESPTA